MSRRVAAVAIVVLAIAYIGSRALRHEQPGDDVQPRLSRAAHARSGDSPGAPRDRPTTAESPESAQRATRAATVTVTVVGVDGKPSEGASVELRGAEARRATTSAGVAQLAAVAPGPYAVVAWADRTAHVQRSIVVRGDDVAVRIVLIAGAGVSGRVIDERNQPVAGAIVVALGTPAWNPRERWQEIVPTAADGAFRFAALPAGSFQFRATHASLAAAASATVALDGTTPHDGITIVMSAGVTVRGRVLDQARQPVAGAHVKVSAPRDSVVLREAPSNVDGTFVLHGVPAQVVSATAIHERGAASPVTVDATRGDVSIDLVLDQLGSIAGTVVDPDGRALPGIRVAASSGERGPRARSDASGRFALTGLAPGEYRLTATRGDAARSSAIARTGDTDVRIVMTGEAVGPEIGRTLSGIVVASGQPVANAAVYASLALVGNGSQLGLRAQTPTATTGADGTFSLAGLVDGDLALVAEKDSIGRSKAVRVPTQMPDQQALVLELVPVGALSGTVRDPGGLAQSVSVMCQSTSAPNASYTVVSGRDGRFRFDRLAPDTYRVSATLGTLKTGMRYFAKQVDVPSGGEATIDLAVEPGTVTLDVTAAPRSGQLGAAGAWVTTGAVTATTASQLELAIAAQGPGASQWVMIRKGAPAELAELAPGASTVCVVPLPAEIQGVGSIAYLNRHADTLRAFCQALTIQPAPAVQTVTVTVDIPAAIDDGAGHR